MSRFKRFTQSLLSGYVVLGANVFYTLAVTPLAAGYLSNDEFGLWAVATSIATYTSLIDFGMSASISRILIDYKNRRTGGEYGSVIKTAALVGIAQGAIIFLIGAALAFVIGPLLDVQKAFERDFGWLVVGLSALMAVSFCTRVFNHLLAAHQRFDIANYAQTFLFVLNYGVMWFCFSRGLGVFSYLIAQTVGTVVTVVVNAAGCVSLKLFPTRDEWGKATWQQFGELFVFGRDIFIYSLGMQLINASQSVLLTRLFGLDVAAVWSVCTRPYLLLMQMVCRILDYSAAALGEMIVRGEKEMLRRRFREIVLVTASLGVALGAMFGVCNTSFVLVWMHGKPILSQIKISWHPANDLLLVAWLLVSASARVHIGLTGLTKDLRFTRHIYFIEGMAFVSLTILLHRFGGISLMILLSIVCSLGFSLPYGLRRTREYFRLSWHELAEWYHAPAILALWVAPVALIVWFCTRDLSLFVRLVVDTAIVSPWTAWTFLRHGLGKPLQAEMVQRAPNWVKPVLVQLGLSKPNV